MLATRRNKWLASSALLLLTLVIVLALITTGGATKGTSPYVGMGDVHRFEAQQMADLKPTALFSDHPYIGMGDLHYFEYLQQKPGAP